MKNKTKTIEVNNIPVEVRWKNIKNVHLTIYRQDASVHISAPRRMTEDSLQEFIISKIEWINKHISIINSQPNQQKKEYLTGEIHYLKGLPYKLNVIYIKSTPKVEIQDNEFINLYVRQGTSCEKREAILRSWYKEELILTLKPLIEKWEKTLNVKINSFDIKRMKTIWGSCNIRKKHIRFNLELIKKQPHCIDYVVAHELTHLIERLHNERFKSILTTHLPSWRETKNELNKFAG